MKLKKFIPTTLRQGKPSIRINGKAGLMAFSKSAGEKLDLKDQESVDFFQDEENPTDWYVAKQKKGSCILREKDKNGSFNLNNTSIARAILKSNDLDDHSSYSFPIGEAVKEGDMKVYAILTFSAKS